MGVSRLPLAPFFLSKIVGQALMNVDIDHLYSLDPELHKHLLSLKTYEGDVQDLGLDFTIAVNDLGERGVQSRASEKGAGPKTAARWPHDGPKIATRWPQDELKMAPRWLHARRCEQDASTWPIDGPKIAQDGPR